MHVADGIVQINIFYSCILLAFGCMTWKGQDPNVLFSQISS